MLAGYATAAIQTSLKDFTTSFQDSFHFIFISFVEQKDGMDIPIARVKNVDNANIVLAADFLDLREDKWQLGPWNNAILSH